MDVEAQNKEKQQLPPPPPTSEEEKKAGELPPPSEQITADETPPVTVISETQKTDEKYVIESVSGFDLLKVRIDKEDSIYVKYDGQMVIDNSLKMEAVTGSKKGFFSGIWAAASTGSVFINRIFLDPSASSDIVSKTIHISGIFPGSITEINIKPGKSWLIASHCFLACTGNVNITTRANLNIVKLVAGVNLFFTEVSVEQNSPIPGKVWITSFGGTYKKDINVNTRNFRINPGLFMAAPNNIASNLKTVGSGSLGAIFATGQFLMMDFSECPDDPNDPDDGIAYLQTVNENYMIFKLTNKVNDSNLKTEIVGSFFEGAVDNAMEGGYNEEISSQQREIEPTEIEPQQKRRRRKYTHRIGELKRNHTKRRIYF